ncbi:uncharacterized protein LOC124636048 [Helicoverpa zea]|uniref:uncharacterized protein LOC124636048 n=1 Tax=Helicoverpa zea TaxID=7113 RepID=UPI001F59C928|nr:uncharacterized protein LOC124636048 [Helicoverpa zea]
MTVITIVLWCPAECQYSSKTKVYIGNKANKLTRELVADAEMKVMAVKPYCEQYLGSKHFQMGQLVYDLRHKYARVVYLYQLVDRDVMYRKHKHNTNLPLMFEVFKLSTEVENTAVMIRLWERKQEDSAMFHSRMKGVLRGGQELQDQHELKPIARVRPGGAPPPPTSKRKNIKWRHVSDRDFL